MSETDSTFDLILVGSSFSSAFFLKKYLEKTGNNVRVLVLERGNKYPHSWHLENYDKLESTSADDYTNKTPQKPWIFRSTFGGTSVAWWGSTPRFLPNDFRIKTLYGIGRDWPITYSDLEPYYGEAERIMEIAGNSEDSPFERSTPYSQKAHLFSEPDKVLKKQFPDQFFHLPCARPTKTTANNRAKCCATGFCYNCPIDSKFTILNEMEAVFQDPRVEVRLNATVQKLELEGGEIKGVWYTNADDAEVYIKGDLFFLGANALFNPFLLMKSGIDNPLTGKGLSEQHSLLVDIFLEGLDNFQGSTAMTGHGYMLYDGAHRSEQPAVLLETWNIPIIRNERGKWRKRLVMKAIFEDIPMEQNYVHYDKALPDKPQTFFSGRSDYLKRGMESLEERLQPVLSALPVESYRIISRDQTESHIIGTTPMGTGRDNSVIDRHLVHHDVRNLVVGGSGAYPSMTPSNPTLTLATLSLWSADKLLS